MKRSSHHLQLRKYRPMNHESFSSSLGSGKMLKRNFSILNKNIILPRVKWRGDIALVETINGVVEAFEGQYLLSAIDSMKYEKVLSEKEFKEYTR